MNHRNYQTFDVTVRTLTPLHIGSGRKLLLDYDYTVFDRKTYRINEDKLLETQNIEDPRILAMLMRTPPGQLLKAPEDFANQELFHYVISGMPRAQASGSQLLEQIKTAAGEPFLPGSSFKGALRTALAWNAAAGIRFDRSTIDERSAMFAARPIERSLFGEDPNHDLFRAMQVSDSSAVGADRLILLNVKVLTNKPDSVPIEVEGIRSETDFRLRMKLDWQLFSAWANRSRNFRLGGKREWLENLASIANAHALERIKKQGKWFTDHKADPIAKFYTQMENLKLGSNQFVTQLGWGGGWDSKTLGSRLQADSRFFEWLVSQPRLKLLKRDVVRRSGAPFPNSRRVAMSRVRRPDGGFNEFAAAPLGWVLVELAEAEDGAK